MKSEKAATDKSSSILKNNDYVFVFHDTVDGNEVQIATMTNTVPKWKYEKWLVKLFQIIVVRIIS